MEHKRILTGIQASGAIHIGNYFGAIRPAIARQSEGECFLFIANLHALTTGKNPESLRSQTYDVIATWLAAGFDVENHVLYLQSDLPLVTELAWYLSCCTGVGLLEKGHAYKDALSRNSEVNHGTFSYPVLMAADILLYDADIVPVGKDQKQHIEMTRDMAGSFNALFGETLKIPEPQIDENVMTIPGLDGRKMSKSYDNTIPLFAERELLRKKIMSIKTDSTPLEAPKSMVGTLVGDLFTLCGTQDEYADLERRLQNGGLGWGHAKEELFQTLDRTVSGMRAKYLEVRPDEALLRKITRRGAAQAAVAADAVMRRVRQAVGILER